jgi:hypothetical protein
MLPPRHAAPSVFRARYKWGHFAALRLPECAAAHERSSATRSRSTRSRTRSARRPGAAASDGRFERRPLDLARHRAVARSSVALGSSSRTGFTQRLRTRNAGRVALVALAKRCVLEQSGTRNAGRVASPPSPPVASCAARLSSSFACDLHCKRRAHCRRREHRYDRGAVSNRWWCRRVE